MVIKKTVFYLFLISGLFGAFQAQAMEAGLTRARSNSAPTEPGTVLVGFDGSQASQLCRTRSTSDPYDNWGIGHESEPRDRFALWKQRQNEPPAKNGKRKKGQLNRVQCLGDPRLLLLTEELKKYSAHLAEKKNEFESADTELSACFEAQVKGAEGDERLRQEYLCALKKRNKLQQEVAEGEGRIASISNAIYLLDMARFN